MPLVKQHNDFRRTAVFAGLALILGEAAAAGSPPQVAAFPKAVRHHVQDLNDLCRRVGGTPSKSPNLVRSIDLTGDGRLDYVVDHGRYRCVNAVSIVSAGHNGAAVSIFVGGRGKTAALGYDGHSHGVTVATYNGRPRVNLVVGALACGQPKDAARAFSDWWFCSRPLDWSATKKKFVFAPLNQARRIHRRSS